MNYQEQLSPWIIYQLLPTMKQLTVARFRTRNDAEGYLKLVQRMLPHAQFAIAFEQPGATLAVPGSKAAQ